MWRGGVKDVEGGVKDVEGRSEGCGGEGPHNTKCKAHTYTTGMCTI